MSLLRTSLAVLAAAQAVVGLEPSAQQHGAISPRAEGGSYVNMIYYWGEGNKQVTISNADAKHLTHVMYAFADVQKDGTVKPRSGDLGVIKRKLGGRWGQLLEFKKKNPHIKTLLSIGGWIGDENPKKKDLEDGVSTAENRNRFAQTSVQLMLDGGFDGIDVDWEFPKTSEQADQHLHLMQTIREKLNKLKPFHNDHRFLLTIAISASPKSHEFLRLPDLAKELDYIYLMAYDFTGGWGERIRHLANLYRSQSMPSSTPELSAAEGVESLVSAGVAASQIVLGVPTYGRSFFNVTLGEETNVRDHHRPEFAVHQLDRKLKVECDLQAVACSAQDPDKKLLHFFDTAETVTIKAKYAQDNNLAGTFFWDLGNDYPGDEALYVAAAKQLGNLDRSTAGLTEFPYSRYDNVRGNSVASKPQPSKSSSESSSDAPTSSSAASTSSNPVSPPAFLKPSAPFPLNTSSTDRHHQSAPTTTALDSQASDDAPPTDDELPSAPPGGIVCAAGESCTSHGEMTPAFDSWGRVVKTVNLEVVVMVSACASGEICQGGADEKKIATTVTEFAFATRCAMDQEVTPMTTTTTVPSLAAASEPIPVTMEGRVANVCMTEFGCKPSEVPRPPPAAAAANRGGSSGSGAGVPGLDVEVSASSKAEARVKFGNGVSGSRGSESGSPAASGPDSVVANAKADSSSSSPSSSGGHPVAGKKKDCKDVKGSHPVKAAAKPTGQDHEEANKEVQAAKPGYDAPNRDDADNHIATEEPASPKQVKGAKPSYDAPIEAVSNDDDDASGPSYGPGASNNAAAPVKAAKAGTNDVDATRVSEKPGRVGPQQQAGSKGGVQPPRPYATGMVSAGAYSNATKPNMAMTGDAGRKSSSSSSWAVTLLLSAVVLVI
ncbi:putative chitinase [Ophiocordyceps camponoti-leonardi (nom. inval.)]|nr:putative chitinase [Ophiocordyceps camponoti-leonardi (nom. inval.)]